MKLSVLVVLFIIQSVVASTYYPTAFKTAFKNGSLRDQELKSRLFTILASHHMKTKGDDRLVNHCDGSGECYRQKVLGYRSARRVLFGKLHLKRDSNGYFVKDVYCDKKISSRTTRVGPDIIPNSRIINCEHTWPQSRFSARFDKATQKSDLHHLFPTDSYANSERGSDEFGEDNGYPVRGCKASHQGSYFEPPRSHRGNVARAIFYFSTRYKLRIREVEEAYLREWHETDPVDEEEMERNDSIYLIQGNRNPFIDYPNLVRRIANF